MNRQSSNPVHWREIHSFFFPDSGYLYDMAAFGFDSMPTTCCVLGCTTASSSLKHYIIKSTHLASTLPAHSVHLNIIILDSGIPQYQLATLIPPALIHAAMRRLI
jgi:hypothetical protein